jgi:hypothetical protein
VRAMLAKRKLRKANNSVLGLIHARRRKGLPRDRLGDLKEHSHSSLFCACHLHAAAAARGV